MEVSYEKFLSSEPFKITGPQGTQSYVHAALLALHSPVLAVNVDQRVLENERKSIEIAAVDGDIDDGAVVRFIEFMYTGDYKAIDPEVLEPSPGVNASLTTEQNGIMNHEEGISTQVDSNTQLNGKGNEQDFSKTWPAKKNKKKSKKRSNNPWFEVMPPEPLECAQQGHEEPEIYDWSSPRGRKQQLWRDFQSKSKALVKQKEAWIPKENTNPWEDHSQVFLCHARLYVFSSRYECESLMWLSLQKLQLALSKFRLFEERVDDITQLVAYVYAQTQDHDTGRDRLRNLIIQYIVCHFESIIVSGQFQALLQEPGHLASDLMVKLIERLD